MNLAPNDPPTSRRMELELHDEMCYVDGGKGQQHSRRVLGSSTMGIIETAETTSKSGLSSQSPLVKKGDALLSPSSTEIANPKKHDSHKVAVVKKAKKRTWKKPEVRSTLSSIDHEQRLSWNPGYSAFFVFRMQQKLLTLLSRFYNFN